VVHGSDRDDAGNFARIMAAARVSGKGPATLVIAPRFKTADDQPAADEHVWTSDGWPSGDLSHDGKDAASRLSSFAVLDRLFAELSDTTRFPGLRRIVLVGHSAGGQLVNRYAAVGRLGEAAEGASGRLEYRFVIANPSPICISMSAARSRGRTGSSRPVSRRRATTTGATASSGATRMRPACRSTRSGPTCSAGPPTT
jgi:hypothetical protein